VEKKKKGGRGEREGEKAGRQVPRGQFGTKTGETAQEKKIGSGKKKKVRLRRGTSHARSAEGEVRAAKKSRRGASKKKGHRRRVWAKNSLIERVL